MFVSCGGYGVIYVQMYNGDVFYNIVVSGLVSGGVMVYFNSFNVINLFGGIYQVMVEDDNWCQVICIVVILDGSFDMSVVFYFGVCGENGSIGVNIGNGEVFYWIIWSGLQSGFVSMSSSNYIIFNLLVGIYIVMVEDDNGCFDYQIVMLIISEGGGFSINVIFLLGSCS